MQIMKVKVVAVVAFSLCLLNFALAGSPPVLAVENSAGYVVSDISGQAEYIVYSTAPDGSRSEVGRGTVEKGMTIPADAILSVPDGSTVMLTNPNDPNDVIELVGPVDFNAATGSQEAYSGGAGEVSIPSMPGGNDVTPSDVDVDTPPATRAQ